MRREGIGTLRHPFTKWLSLINCVKFFVNSKNIYFTLIIEILLQKRKENT